MIYTLQKAKSNAHVHAVTSCKQQTRSVSFAFFIRVTSFVRVTEGAKSCRPFNLCYIAATKLFGTFGCFSCLFNMYYCETWATNSSQLLSNNWNLAAVWSKWTLKFIA